MQKEFVTHTIALKLKELGFNEPCFGYYTPIKSWMIQGTKINPEPHFHGPNWSNVDNTFYFMYKSNSFGDRTEVVYNSYFTKAIYNIAVPLWQQVIDWFDTKGIFITVRTYYIDTVIEYGFTIKYGTEYITKYEFNSKYEANKNAIVKAIELYESFLKEIENE